MGLRKESQRVFCRGMGTSLHLQLQDFGGRFRMSKQCYMLSSLFTCSKEMLLLSRRRTGRTIWAQQQNKDPWNFRKTKYTGYECIGTFGMKTLLNNSVAVVKYFSPKLCVKYFSPKLCAYTAAAFQASETSRLRWNMYEWACQFVESRNHLDWKRVLGPWSPTISPALPRPPQTDVLKCNSYAQALSSRMSWAMTCLVENVLCC